MLIDLHANPGDLSPEDFADAVREAGLDAVVVTSTNTVDRLGAYLDALDDVGVTAFAGVELALDKGALVLIPRDADADVFADAQWSNGAKPWDLEAALERIADFDGAIIASHPYCRDLPSGLSDRIFKVRPLMAVETRVGRGQLAWDSLAEGAAAKLGAARVGSSSGDIEYLGRAATIMAEGIEVEEDLVNALEAGNTLAVELDDPKAPRDRTPPRREPRDDEGGRGRRDEGRGRRDEGGRGRRDEGGRGRGPGGGGGRGGERGGRGGGAGGGRRDR